VNHHARLQPAEVIVTLERLADDESHRTMAASHGLAAMTCLMGIAAVQHITEDVGLVGSKVHVRLFHLERLVYQESIVLLIVNQHAQVLDIPLQPPDTHKQPHLRASKDKEQDKKYFCHFHLLDLSCKVTSFF
jgi:hypothetical protein